MNQTPYDRVKLARSSGRPTGLDYIRHIFQGFIELHGDRRFADDPAIVGGVARLDGQPVTVLAMEKGVDAFIEKPFNVKYLDACINNLLKKRNKN